MRSRAELRAVISFAAVSGRWCCTQRRPGGSGAAAAGQRRRAGGRLSERVLVLEESSVQCEQMAVCALIAHCRCNKTMLARVSGGWCLRQLPWPHAALTAACHPGRVPLSMCVSAAHCCRAGRSTGHTVFCCALACAHVRACCVSGLAGNESRRTGELGLDLQGAHAAGGRGSGVLSATSVAAVFCDVLHGLHQT